MIPKKESLIHKIHKLVIWMDKEADNYLQSSYGITYSQFLIMFMIGLKDASSQKKVADYCNFTEAAISKQVENLRRNELLTREENKENRREHILKLTEKGAKIFEKALGDLEKGSESIFNVLTKEETKLFETCVDKLMASTQNTQTNFTFLKHLK